MRAPHLRVMRVLEPDIGAMRAHFRWITRGTQGCVQLDLRRDGKTERSFHAGADSLIAAVLAHPEHAANVGVNPRPASWAGSGFRECGADKIEIVSAVRIDIDCARPMALATEALSRAEAEADSRRRAEAGKPAPDLPPVTMAIAARCAAEATELLAGVEEHKADLRRAIDAACRAEDIQLRPEFIDRLVTYTNRAAASQPTTEAECSLTIDAGRRLSDWAKAQGWGEPLVTCSGNGCHVWFPIAPIQLDETNREAIQLACVELERLARIKVEVLDPRLRVDHFGGFAAVTRLAGCPNRKGVETAERLHGLSHIVQGAERANGAALADWLRSEGNAILRLQQEERAKAEAERRARLAANPMLDGSRLRNLDARVDGAMQGFLRKHPLANVGHDETLGNLLLLARLPVWMLDLDFAHAEGRFRALVNAHYEGDYSPHQLEIEIQKALKLANSPVGARGTRGALIERWAAEDEQNAKPIRARVATAAALEPEPDSDIEREAIVNEIKAQPEQGGGDSGDGTDWRSLLSMTSGTKKSRPEPRKCLENVLTTLRHCPDWKGVLSYNEFADCIELRRSLPRAQHHGDHSDLGQWRDGLALWAIAWFHEQLGFEPSFEMMARAVDEVARENAYHPVRDWLRSLQWDRRPRCDRMLADIFGAEDNQVNRAIGSMWMISACARVMQPGCQADHLLILEGPQGTRKSTALRTLVGDPWFCNSAIDLRTKDAAIALRGCLVYEFDELDAFRGRDVQRIKSFLTLRTDDYRPPYERRARKFPRQCVFAGSTNESQYLSDPTGNRRFWPVRCGAIDIPGLTAVRDQLWAESYARYLAGESWYIDSLGLAEQVKEAQTRREEVDPWQGPIAAWWGNLHEDRQRQGVTTADVFASVLELKLGHAERRDEMRAAACLRRVGLERRHVMNRGVRAWRYFPEVVQPSDAKTGGAGGAGGDCTTPRWCNEAGGAVGGAQ